jgi:methionyl-tRNA synthetase
MNPVTLNLALILLTLWTVPWKVYSVWLAVKNNHKKWFVALLIVNTVGILEIFYIFRVAKKSWAEVSEAFGRAWRSAMK